MSQPSLQNKPLSLSEKLNWLRLCRTENVGPITFYRLVERYASASQALEALPELSRRGGRKKPLVAPKMDVIEAEYETLQKNGGDIVTAMCPEYPLALSAIDDAPPILSYLGDIRLAQQSCLGMVGARNASLNGKKLASRLAADLGKQDQIIVSGLARGIDTAAHTGALERGTIAVVAGGIDIVYPPENQGLFEQIREKGLILAESKLGQQPFAASFPRRNRIVSGLSKAVIVVEATMRSGSLITARMAGEQGRDVMAVPGSPIDPRAQGPNHLIREGATLIRDASDIMEIIRSFSGTGMREPLYSVPYHLGPSEIIEDVSEKTKNEVIDQLSYSPIAVDELIRSCQLSIPALQTILLELELAGRVQRLPGNAVSLREAG
jgi:DNA processing protein